MASLTLKYTSQRGAVLLMFMLVLISASSYVMLNQLNAATKSYSRDVVTSRVLSEAKQTLIGYALKYPENNTGFGPGYLPCPDRNNDGFINAGACASSTATTIGRFPWRSLGVREMVDSSGARLWYVLSDNYRNNPKINTLGGVMNSDNAGQLTLDGNGDIVALIIAPGAPVGSQPRSLTEIIIANEIANYLEDENAEIAGAFDVAFVSSGGTNFNDKVIAITRQELMSLVEKRVLAEVEDALNNYQTTYNAFPWLSSFADPSNSAFRSAISNIRGHAPFHWSADPDSIDQGGAVAGRNPFITNLNFSWDFSSAAIFEYASSTSFTASCLLQTNCGVDDPIGAIDSITLAAECTWSNQVNPRQRVDCTMDQNGSWSEVQRYSVDNLFRRRYVMRKDPVLEFNGDSVTMTNAADTVLGTRTRTVNKVNFTLTNAGSNDVFYVIDYTRPDIISGWSILDYAYAIIPSATVIDSISLELPYDLDVDGVDLNSDGDYVDANEVAPELPSWFVVNDWHELVYFAYASGEPLPGDTTAGQDCVSLGTACVSVTINGTPMTNVRAAVFSAGVDLSTGTARPNGTLSDYFEGENSSPVNDSFLETRMTAAYNDQTRIISTAP